MHLSLALEINPTGWRRTLTQLGGSLTSFTPEMKEIRRLQARSVDLTFRQGGRPQPWARLAETTIAARRRRTRRTGEQPVAGFETPLRAFDDSLRKALVDTTGTAPGSASYVNETEAVAGISLPYAARQQARRPFLVLLPTDQRAYQDVLTAGLRRRVAAVQRL
ncbi:MAG: hypothetical protein SFU56_09210 [Capsulimonadales bacterium]|nr:hypothetical protein [Capsulimonadales bacterium]